MIFVYMCIIHSLYMNENLRPQEQMPQNPNEAAKGFLDKWGTKLAILGAGIPTAIFASYAFERLTVGDVTGAVLFGVPAVINGVTTALQVEVERRKRATRL
jgi:hypothetical protein